MHAPPSLPSPLDRCWSGRLADGACAGLAIEAALHHHVHISYIRLSLFTSPRIKYIFQLNTQTQLKKVSHGFAEAE
jgi:hypothetical protein